MYAYVYVWLVAWSTLHPFLAYSPVSFPRTQSEHWAHWCLIQGQRKSVWIGKLGRHPGKPAMAPGKWDLKAMERELGLEFFILSKIPSN